MRNISHWPGDDDFADPSQARDELLHRPGISDNRWSSGEPVPAALNKDAMELKSLCDEPGPLVVLAVFHQILKCLLSGFLDFCRGGVVDVASARDFLKAAIEHFLRPTGGKSK
jgi:hypothetical protein